MLKFFAVILSSIILVYFSLNLFIKAEEHDYQVLKVIDDVEIRIYDEMIYASYTPENDSKKFKHNSEHNLILKLIQD